jgi:hypothetical protein
MKGYVVGLLVAMSVMGMYGCKKDNSAPANSASVMFVNGCAGTTGIDAKIDNVNVSGAANLAFSYGSGYKYVKAANSVIVGFYLTNVGTPVTTDTVSISPNLHYTAFSGGLITAPTFVLTLDDMAAPATNNAKLRFINLSNDIMSVTATAQNQVIDSVVTSMKVSPYIQVPAGNYELKAGDPSNINTVVSTGSTSLAAGKIYTLMLTGSLAGTGSSALKLTLVNNN